MKFITTYNYPNHSHTGGVFRHIRLCQKPDKTNSSKGELRFAAPPVPYTSLFMRNEEKIPNQKAITPAICKGCPMECHERRPANINLIPAWLLKSKGIKLLSADCVESMQAICMSKRSHFIGTYGFLVAN